MRRKDKQITDPKIIDEIFQNAECCRLGFVDNGIAYIVPMSYGFVKENGSTCLYFHSSPKGRKIDLIQQNGKASFEIEANYRIKPGDQACKYSCYYQSVIGHGTITLLTEEQDKQRALRCVMQHYSQREDWEFLPKMLPLVVGIRLEIEEMTAKGNQPQS